MRKAVACVFFIVFCCIVTVYAQNTQLQLAQQYNANGQPQKAYEIYRELYDKQNEIYYPYFIANLLNLKKFDEAESITKKMLRRHPDENEYTLKLATIYTQQGKTRDADKLYTALIEKMPADVAAISSLGMRFYQNGNLDYAIQAFKQGRKMLNSDDVFVHELLTLYRYKHDKMALTNEFLNFLPKNPAYAGQAQSVLASLYEGDADYEMLKLDLFKRLQKDPGQKVYVDMLIWQFLQQQEYDQALNQALALNRRNQSDDNTIFDLSRTLAESEAYDAAIRGYQYLLDKGKESPLYISSKIELIDTRSLKVTSGKYQQADLLTLEKDYHDLLAEFGKTRNTVFAMQKLARLEAFKLHNFDAAQQILEQAVTIPGISQQSKAACKLDLGDIYLINDQPWEATLLYSQVEKDFPDSEMEQDAKLRNAKMAYYTGDFEWAKGMLDVLKAATSKLIANDALNLQLLINDNLAADSGEALKMYARADLQIFAGQPQKALNILDSIDRQYPGHTLADDILMARARILLERKDYAAAVIALKSLALNFPQDLWADDAVFMLGDIYENKLKDKDEAKQYYEKIITGYPGSLWLNEARKRFRILRGDVTGA